MFHFSVTEDFTKSFQKLDRHIQIEIKNKLRFLNTVENPLSFAKKLQGFKNIFRFRVGDYRIIFQLEKQSLTLLLVKHRRDIYEAL